MENELIALDFLKHYRSAFPHMIDFDKKMTLAFHASSWPNAVVVDSKGKIIAHEYVWKKGIEKLEQAMEEAASKKPYIAGSSIVGRTFCQGGICYAPPEGEDSILGRREELPALASSPDGSILLVYTSNEAGDNNIYLQRFQRGEAAQRYQVTATTSDEYDADVTVSPDGTVWLTWVSNVDSIYDVYAASLSGGRLSSPIRVTRSTEDAFHPRIAVDNSGNPWITYYKWRSIEGRPRDRDVFLCHYEEGAWNSEVEVSPPEPAVEDHSDPDIAPFLNGMVVAWSYDYHPSIEGNTLDCASPTVFVRFLPQRSTAIGPMELVGSKGREQRIKDISPAVASRGALLAVAWDAGKSIMVRRREADGWLPREKLSSGEGPCNAPAVAIGGDDLFVCYSQLRDGGWRIVGRSFSRGMWGEEKILDRGEGDCRFPALAADSAGSVWVAYAAQKGSEVRVRLTRWASR